MLLMLDELNRLVWDIFLLDDIVEIERKKESDSIRDKEFVFILVNNYLT